MSGQRVILFMAAGVLLVASVTLVLYFLTRQLDEAQEQDGLPRAPAAIVIYRGPVDDGALPLAPAIATIGPTLRSATQTPARL